MCITAGLTVELLLSSLFICPNLKVSALPQGYFLKTHWSVDELVCTIDYSRPDSFIFMLPADTVS